MKAVFINASPRKKFNTAQMLESAMQGAREAGAEVERVDLFDYEFTGCRSCFACHIKNAKTHGVCAIRDSIRPVIEKCQEADVLVFGSPVYFGYPTGQLRSLLERLLFPLDTYMIDENGQRVKVPHKPAYTGMIYTMNCPEDMLERFGLDRVLAPNGNELARLYGYNETIYAGDTYQFADYSRYDCNMFSEEEKRRHRDEHFPIDLQKAREMGRRLVEMAALEKAGE